MATNKYYNPLNNAISSGSSGPWHNATNVSTSAGQWNAIQQTITPGLQNIYKRIYTGQSTRPGEWMDVPEVRPADTLAACMRLPYPSDKNLMAYAVRQLPHINATSRAMLEVVFDWDIPLSDWDAINFRKRLMGL